jgi:hypothetical protein
MYGQLAYISGVTLEVYLVAVPLLALEVRVPPERVYLSEQVITVNPDLSVAVSYRVPMLQVGQEVMVGFADGNIQVPVIIAARPMEG